MRMIRGKMGLRTWTIELRWLRIIGDAGMSPGLRIVGLGRTVPTRGVTAVMRWMVPTGRKKRRCRVRVGSHCLMHL